MTDEQDNDLDTNLGKDRKHSFRHHRAPRFDPLSMPVVIDVPMRGRDHDAYVECTLTQEQYRERHGTVVIEGLGVVIEGLGDIIEGTL